MFRLPISRISAALLACGLLSFSSLNAAQTAAETNIKNAQAFLVSQQEHLSTSFPYRINLLQDGQIAKNQAGVRIAEDASQLMSDNVGQLFYYDLYDGAMRVPHWHANATEAGVVLEGKLRITIWEGHGKTKSFTVEQNGTWNIPAASLHVLENVGDTHVKFLVNYNVPNSADRDFITAWAAIPEAILERAVGLSAQDLQSMPRTTQQRMQLSEPDPNAKQEKEEVDSPFTNNFSHVKPIYESQWGEIHRIDADNTPGMTALSIQKTVLHPGAMRVPHWYVGGNDLLYVYKGSAFFTMMNDDGTVYNVTVKPGDLIFIPVGNLHTFVNTGNEDLEIYETFSAPRNVFEINLLDGAQHFRTNTMAAALSLSDESIEKLKKTSAKDYIIAF